jgi:hypothetical protein
MNRRNYWLLFGAVQVVGLIAPWFANVHTSPFPLFLGFGLLLLGCFVEFVFHLSDLVGLALAVPINGAAWFLGRKILLRDSAL